MRQQILDLTPDLRLCLDDFVKGSNGEVVSALQRWQRGEGERQIYLWGDSGTGKTHLLRALVRPEEFVRTTPDTRFEPDQNPRLAVDDVHLLGKEGALDLFHRYNERRDQGLGLLVSGSCPPARLPLFPDLKTRLAWGLVLRISPLNDEEKITALHTHAQSLGLTLPPAVAQYLLTHCPRRNDYLFSLMKEFHHWTLATHRATITLPMVREILGTPHS
ncbi:MAG: DnaA regulatory inactivator Hda [Ferrovum sp.]|jgi:DnaA family protein|nr:DnaA regulatory inactivator Hda [Ferrovum sp.]